jgi:hypothetical protein
MISTKNNSNSKRPAIHHGTDECIIIHSLRKKIIEGEIKDERKTRLPPAGATYRPLTTFEQSSFAQFPLNYLITLRLLH